jgi:histidinol-phosphate/aromatic aminotransferase/cobyric acid decarboxylase-like protein
LSASPSFAHPAPVSIRARAFAPPPPTIRTAACYHGGAFFGAIGEDFSDLSRRHSIINADVLDAWFPPAPAVLEALHGELPWLLRTSPPTHCHGLIETIARVRRVPADTVVCGAGSSDLIFRAFREWLSPDSRVLLLDPTYGEYAHVCEQVIGCRVERLRLHRDQDYRVNLDELRARLSERFDLVVLVNPNNPTGQHIARGDVEDLIRGAAASTRFWIDEAYLEYVDGAESLEQFAATRANVAVCKSLSKVYALSGARAAYMVVAPVLADRLRVLTPPWGVSLTAQVAAVHALQADLYYRECYAQTSAQRHHLIDSLRTLAPRIGTTGAGNFVLCHLPSELPDAEAVEARCRAEGLYIRDVSRMVPRLGPRVIRLAVKDPDTQNRMLEILTTALVSSPARR